MTIVRSASRQDLPVIQSIARHTIDRNYREFFTDEGVDWYISGPSDEYLRDHLEQTLVMCDDQGIVGFCVSKDNFIELMMINDERHRSGLGTRLLRHCEEELFKQYSELKLESFEPNTKANNFYRKNGWRESSVEFDETSGLNKITFVKQKT